MKKRIQYCNKEWIETVVGFGIKSDTINTFGKMLVVPLFVIMASSWWVLDFLLRRIPND